MRGRALYASSMCSTLQPARSAGVALNLEIFVGITDTIVILLCEIALVTPIRTVESAEISNKAAENFLRRAAVGVAKLQELAGQRKIERGFHRRLLVYPILYAAPCRYVAAPVAHQDRKSTRLNSS